MKEVIGQQGEVRITRIDVVPEVETRHVERSAHGYIISHSESGHHHVLTDGDVMERVKDVPPGMQIFYAILKDPARFEQTAATPHGAFDLPPGAYEFRVSRGFNQFAEEARRVAD